MKKRLHRSICVLEETFSHEIFHKYPTPRHSTATSKNLNENVGQMTFGNIYQSGLQRTLLMSIGLIILEIFDIENC